MSTSPGSPYELLIISGISASEPIWLRGGRYGSVLMIVYSSTDDTDRRCSDTPFTGEGRGLAEGQLASDI